MGITINIQTKTAIFSTILLLFTAVNMTYAGDVQILAADFQNNGRNYWSVNVTLKHDDSGWDHYADNWRIVDHKGNILGDRILMHPHVGEQPFTRGLGNVTIPEGIKTVFIEAHDKVHGWTQNKLQVNLEKASNGHLQINAKQ
jgi:hypothetical protein